MRKLPIFATVTLGVYRTPYAYRKALENIGVCIAPVVYEMLTHIPLTAKQVELDLVRVPFAEFEYGSVPYMVLKEGLERGLTSCPFEVAFALGLQREHHLSNKVLCVMTDEDATVPGSTQPYYPKKLEARPLFELGRREGLYHWPDRPEERSGDDWVFYMYLRKHYWGRPAVSVTKKGESIVSVIAKRTTKSEAVSPWVPFYIGATFPENTTFPQCDLEYIFVQPR